MGIGHLPKNIYDLIKRRPDQTVLEIGGGRSPMFNEGEIAHAKARYVINDISQKELSKAPDYCSKLCFDIASSDSDVIKENAASCSVIFSKMVFEHVKDASQAYRNIHTLLEPGGICLNLHPILFSPPFVANYLFPESLSASLLKLIDDSRVETEIPKFPAYYNRCRISIASMMNLPVWVLAESGKFRSFITIILWAFLSRERSTECFLASPRDGVGIF